MSNETAIARATGRSRVYAFLAQALADPASTRGADLEQALLAAESALEILGETRSRAALVAVRRALEDLDEDELLAAYQRVFGHLVSGDCPPYEGEYGNAHIFQKSQCLADTAGFYQAFGLTLAPDLAERADHITVELEFLHVLAAKEAYALAQNHGSDRLAIVRDAIRRYLQDHLARWVPAFAARLESKANDGFYAALARLLSAFVAEEALRFGVTPGPATIVSGEMQGDDAPAGCEGCSVGAIPIPAMRGEP